jgi:hypothetical protein
MGLRISLLLHCVLLLLCLGCAHHRPVAVVAPVDDEVSEGRDFVLAVAKKMPLWDADAISEYEQMEIATVKADIVMAQEAEDAGAFLEDVVLLQHDWDALLALDEILKKESLI